VSQGNARGSAGEERGSRSTAEKIWSVYRIENAAQQRGGISRGGPGEKTIPSLLWRGGRGGGGGCFKFTGRENVSYRSGQERPKLRGTGKFGGTFSRTAAGTGRGGRTAVREKKGPCFHFAEKGTDKEALKGGGVATWGRGRGPSSELVWSKTRPNHQKEKVFAGKRRKPC